MFIKGETFLQRGVTLVETIVFIIIVSVGVIGLVSALGPLVKYSAEPMQQKQLMALAESLLSEILHQPYTWCDPDDANASTALSYADCTNSQDKGGAALTAPTPNDEARTNTAPTKTLDNVADYGNFNMNDVTDAAGNNAMTGYTAEVTVARAGLALGAGSDDAALVITVKVSRGTENYSLTGYRYRYAPRT